MAPKERINVYLPPGVLESFHDFIYRKDNVFLLTEHQDDKWVFTLGVRPRAEDLQEDGLYEVKLGEAVLSVVPQAGSRTPDIYWVLSLPVSVQQLPQSRIETARCLQVPPTGYTAGPY